MTHIVAGYPSLEDSEKIAKTMADAGVDFIEIQIPFSDPVADGPVIMEANKIALEQGINIHDCMKLMEKLSKYVKTNRLNTKLLFMSYFNPVFRYGVNNFCQKAKDNGCYGLIIPDMPLQEEKYEHLMEHCRNDGLKLIQIVSPLTTVERLREILRNAEGFIYCVAGYGVTGQKRSFNDISLYLRRVREFTDLELAVGFGIADKRDVEEVHNNAEIAVIGSKFIKIVKEKNYLSSLTRFLKEITS